MNSRTSRKTQKQMFLLVSGSHICTPQKGYKHGVSIQSFINLSKTFFRTSGIWKYRTDLILGEAFCIFIFFYFLDSGLSVFNGLQCYFWLHNSKCKHFMWTGPVWFIHMIERERETETTYRVKGQRCCPYLFSIEVVGRICWNIN